MSAAPSAPAGAPDTGPGRRLFFVRHGETDWNVAGRLQGRRDVPLNALGRIQAAQVGRVLNQLVGDVAGVHYVSSPLSRAAETMRILRTTLDLPASTFASDIRLAEISFGRWEGQTWPELRRRDHDGVRRRDLDPWRFQPPGGESYLDLCARVEKAIADLPGDAVIVTHGGVVRAALHVLAGMPEGEAALLPVRQGAVYVVAGGVFKVAD
ncbi:histidine phosphatase family protein [Xanthobacter tagetidis]|jgi:probable phosphoglycerate mutase|uniref:Histidine phosphatase family protein n=1 Tax=Xanthobacter tagetidis TaxID=60216 RepID=A0A3L7AE14_9HYPH|nr:histidine phosphatase family protein [Xanthobacter tagetidis]MBB6305960.1 putative phosphoglycerate mutase [Xanthobacter tagetidis]RLP78477.1 histidine phosphatase family protein [Xanthobacter tagetidis]